jgi:hypothetical protein
LTSLLSNQTINIGATPIVLTKNLVILAEGPGTNITGSGSRVFEMSAGVQVQFLDVIITAGTSMTGGAINNPGILTLKNVNIEPNPGVSGASLITNSPGAQLFVSGNVNINQ